MIKLTTLGTKDNPIRISSTPLWLRCPWFNLLKMYYEDQNAVLANTTGTKDISAPSARIGTALDKAVKTFSEGFSVEVAIEAGISEYAYIDPLIIKNYCELEQLFEQQYGKVRPEYNDVQIFDHIDDIWFLGHPDQVREKEGKLYLWDMKASQYAGKQLCCDYYMQLLLYSHFLGIEIGGIIRLTDIRTKGQIFYPVKIDPYFKQLVIKKLIKTIKSLRRGILIEPTPGSQCVYCAGLEPGLCWHRLKPFVENKCPNCGKTNCTCDFTIDEELTVNL